MPGRGNFYVQPVKKLRAMGGGGEAEFIAPRGGITYRIRMDIFHLFFFSFFEETGKSFYVVFGSLLSSFPNVLTDRNMALYVFPDAKSGFGELDVFFPCLIMSLCWGVMGGVAL